MRTMVVLALAAVLAPVPGVPPAPVSPVDGSGQVVRFALPVPGPPVVVAPFRAPLTRFGPGHRGVDLATVRAGPVFAAADGVVRFAGTVAGRGVVVLAHAGGITTEYEPIRPVVRAGQTVLRSALPGTVSGVHGDCRPEQCVHWAARRDGGYLDPMTLLA